MKLTLARKLRELRDKLDITQQELAKRLGSSQSRVAKIEAGDPSVSMELLMRSLLAAGADRSEIGRSIASRRRSLGPPNGSFAHPSRRLHENDT